MLKFHECSIYLDNIKLPKLVRKEKELPTFETVFNIVKGTESELPVLLAAWLSLRIGEVIGLQFQDVDAEKGVIKIRRTIIMTNDGEKVRAAQKGRQMSVIYQASNLRKYYGGELALDLPEFSLEKGATLVLEGPNGSGKSTLLRILAFLEEPTSGTLTLACEGEPRRNCTLLLQEPWLLRSRVFDNVALGLRLRGIRSNLQAHFNAAMQAAGFQEPERYAMRRQDALSGGERQRVALAARLILNPAVLLLDEPTAHVDAKSAEHIKNALLKAHATGMTIICATHDENLASALHAEKMRLEKPQ